MAQHRLVVDVLDRMPGIGVEKRHVGVEEQRVVLIRDAEEVARDGYFPPAVLNDKAQSAGGVSRWSTAKGVMVRSPNATELPGCNGRNSILGGEDVTM